MRKEKGKKKMLEYDTDKDEPDQIESDYGNNKDRTSKKKSKSVMRALISTNERLRRSTHYKNPVKRYGYNE